MDLYERWLRFWYPLSTNVAGLYDLLKPHLKKIPGILGRGTQRIFRASLWLFTPNKLLNLALSSLASKFRLPTTPARSARAREQVAVADNLLGQAAIHLDKGGFSYEDWIQTITTLGIAAKALNKARRLDPAVIHQSAEKGNATLDYLMGEMCFMEATAHRKWAAIAPDSPAIVSNSGIGVTSEGIVGKSHHHDIWTFFSRQSWRRKRYQLGVEAINKAIAYDPNNVAYRKELVRLLTGQSYRRRARRAADEALKLTPDDVELHTLKARI